MQTEDTPKLDLSSLESLDFTPAWAKKDAGVTVGKTTAAARSFDDRAPAEGRKPFPRGNAPRGERKVFDRSGSGQRHGGGKGSDRHPRVFEKPQRLEAEVKILPETKALGTIIRKLQQDFHAYKLKDLAYFFLDNPQSVLLRITPKAPSPGEAPKPLGFHQCKACSFASQDESDVVAHALAVHLGDYYDTKEVECEPPKGKFSCVAKCGLSGELLGPPNMHDFNAKVREMIRTHYPDMTEDRYRSHLEMVKAEDVIEEWRKSAVKKTVFVRKGAAEGDPVLSREQAEGEFRRTILPSLLDSPKHLMITADIALKSPMRSLQWAARDALEAERRAPYNMCFALRGAFHHRKMHFFRANDSRGQEFVMGIEPKTFDVAHAIPELARIAKFIEDNPCSTKAELPADSESEKQLAWLVSTGHVIAFTNGVYSAVEKFPKYGPQWRKKKDVKPAAEAAPAVAEPSAEDVAPAAEPVPADENADAGDAPPAEETPQAQGTALSVAEEKSAAEDAASGETKEKEENEGSVKLAE
ncbi:MAG: hypothetical protein K6F50_09300 [Kiritimatiellae bacterium]|nr:hypothetical protein [Kiritimatiellia bacterium]